MASMCVYANAAAVDWANRISVFRNVVNGLNCILLGSLSFWGFVFVPISRIISKII